MKKISLGPVTVIDDTYNANPDGVAYALQFLKRHSGRKIFVFADMLELGDFAEKEHQKIADLALDAEVSLLFTFGKLSKATHSPAMPAHHFSDKSQLNQELVREIKPGDVVLVKGSRGMKMEETVEYIQKNVVA
jgi:UDP-N-acetylmuramoyl-tripeptide--D-alanyl-D-alanine ligase